MLNLAERASKGGANEHLTNFVTALSQTAFNLGSVLGPFAVVPVIEIGGFRGALGPRTIVAEPWRRWRCRRAAVLVQDCEKHGAAGRANNWWYK